MTGRREALETSRRALLGGVAAAGAGLVLPAGVRAQAAPRRGGSLKIAVPYNPASLDPMTGRNGPDFHTLYALYDGLTTLDPKTMEVRPGLARAWNWRDPKTLVLELREDVTFHDGTPFDADAAKFNLDRYRGDARSNVKPDSSSIEAVEVVGKTGLVLHLTQHNAALPTVLSDRVGLMVSPAAIKAAKDGNIDRAPVGTGPFKYVSWADNDRIVLARNDRYWQAGLPYLDGLTLVVITEQATLMRSIVAGENDGGVNLDIQNKPLADRAGNLILTPVPTTYFWGAYFNYGKPPLDDVRVRQALCWAVDRDAMNQAIAYGLDTTASSVLPSQHWACDPATTGYYRYDVAKARQLLAEAGHPDGIDVEMLGWPDQASIKRQEVAIEQAKAAGFRLQVSPLAPQDSVQFFGPQQRGSARLTGMGGYPDPTQQYSNLFNAASFYNAAHKELPGYRELIEATFATDDQASRKAAFARLQKFVIDNALNWTFMFQTHLLVTQPKVHGITADLTDKTKYHAAWVEA